MIYSREADTEFDFTRPMTTMRVTAGSDGKTLTGWKHTAASAFATARMAPGFLGKDASGKKFDPFQINGSDHWYTIPNQLVLTEMNKIAQSATPSGQLRSVAPAWTFWAVESMIDEMAHKMGVDPLALRLQLLDGKGKNAGKGPTANGAKRLASVLRRRSRPRPATARRCRRIPASASPAVTSQERASAAWTATAANVTVNPADGSFTVNRLTVGTDLGTLINPNAVEAQVQGATLWGLSLATLEEVEMKDGRLQASNFDTYTPCRMENAPDLDVILVETGQYPVGCGEPAVTSVAPAIANAIFAASGARVRSLPITAEKVKAAL